MNNQYLLVHDGRIFRYQAPMGLGVLNVFNFGSRVLSATGEVKRLSILNLKLINNSLNKIPPVKLGKDIVAVWNLKFD